jgi:hypothetical protein
MDASLSKRSPTASPSGRRTSSLRSLPPRPLRFAGSADGDRLAAEIRIVPLAGPAVVVFV